MVGPEAGNPHRPENQLDVLDGNPVPVCCGGGELSLPGVQPFLEGLRDGDRLGCRGRAPILRHLRHEGRGAMPASFFVPWKVLDAYLLRPLLSFPTKTWRRRRMVLAAACVLAWLLLAVQNTERVDRIARTDCQLCSLGA